MNTFYAYIYIYIYIVESYEFFWNFLTFLSIQGFAARLGAGKTTPFYYLENLIFANN